MSRGWIELDATDRSAATAAIDDVERLLDRHPAAAMDHDLAWLLETYCDGERHPVVYLCYEDARLIGYTPLLAHPSAVPLSLGNGEITVGRYTVEELTVVGGPIIAPEVDDAAAGHLIIDLFDKVSARLRSRQIVFVQSAPLRSRFFEMLHDGPALRKLFHVYPYGSSYQRRLIRLPETFEAYMKQLGPKTRPDLQRHSRKLRQHVGAQLQTSVYDVSDSLSEFLGSAEAISRKTYQWHLHGQGLKDRRQFETRLSAAARRGWLRCYILSCQTHPVAFMVGYVYKDRYYSTDIGYDPGWARWSVGNVLHCEVVRDLIDSKAAKFFDFIGDSPHKERLSNFASEEANFYLFPRTLEGSGLKYSLSAVRSISTSAAQMLQLLGLKAKLRKWLRRTATARHTTSGDAA